MTEHESAHEPASSAPAERAPRLSRRATLKGAAVVGTAAWVTPVISAVSMESAAAASTPPTRVETGPPAGPGPDSEPTATDRPTVSPTADVEPANLPGSGPNPTAAAVTDTGVAGVSAVNAAAPSGVAAAQATSALPKTGSDGNAAMVAMGAGAILLGGAAVAAAKRLTDDDEPGAAQPDRSA